jgi:toxin-antitoxin system PIN domain toxin
MKKMHLPDVNVWLALTFDSHVHHPAAKSWFDALPSSSLCYFCRLTQQGLLRLATNLTVVGKHALTLADAWSKYDVWLSDPRIGFHSEPNQIETRWRSFTQHHSFSLKVWNDGYLAAFALESGLELVTFDQSFAAYSGIKCRILK